ncbi:MAG TPA: M64 family metallopeptidase [Jatrophihabitantaceae bacterium]
MHVKVVNLWLTPNPMTVRRGAAPDHDPIYRFRLRAEFDDGALNGVENHTCGDVTRNHEVTWTPPEQFGSGGFFEFRDQNHAGEVVHVTATLPTPDGPKTAKADVIIAPRWSDDPNVPKAEIIPGAGHPGVLRCEDVPNFLFLGCGFPDRDSFEGMTDAFVQSLRTNRLVRPFDILTTSINMWRVFTQTPYGVSIVSEVFVTTNSDGQLVARSVPPARKPAANAQRIVLEELLYLVGLPSPPHVTMSNDDIRAEWHTANFPDPTGFLPHGDDSLIEQWKVMGNRAFVDEIDAFPSMSYGRTPSTDRSTTYDLGLHPDRGGDTALQALYAALRAADGTVLDTGAPVGTLWAGADPRFHFDNTTYVVLVSPLQGGRAAAGDVIAISAATRDLDFPVAPVGGRKAFTLIAQPIDGTVTEDATRTLAHEMGHKFGLGDEYSEFAIKFEAQDATLDGYANLQTEANTFNDQVQKQIVAEEIKWNWHRIAKAAVIQGAITPSGDGFRIPVRPGEGFQFNDGDALLLRLRKWGEALQKKPTVLAEAKALKVKGKGESDFVNVVASTPGSVVIGDLTGYVAGSIVYMPTPAHASRFTNSPFAGLMIPAIMHAITEKHRPMTDTPCVPDGFQIPLPELGQGGLEVDLHDYPFILYPHIAGLFEGGLQVTCGVFRPTGMCMMNNNHDETAWFCAICRYVMVDFVNPYLHWQIDRDYRFYYPPVD